jgi:hypothetical protein
MHAMNRANRMCALLACAAMALAHAHERAPASADKMRLAALTFLASLAPAQSRDAALAFDDPARTTMRYTPGSRAGLTLKDMDPSQRDKVQALLRQGLSEAGHRKVVNIIELENVLREIEMTGFLRDPGKYTVSVFGAPSTVAPWGWRFEGHHLSLNFTLIGNTVAVDTPLFMGANPAEVQAGPKKGLRVLKEEEDRGWALLASLDAAQKRVAVISDRTYGDITSGTGAAVAPPESAGLAAGPMRPEQQKLLERLLDAWLDSMPSDLAQARRSRVFEGGIDKLRFAWAGSTSRGKPFYFRVQGPRFLLEFDASQDSGNHLHTVWRDFDGDFGRDLLREHYQTSRGTAHSHR